MDRAGERLRMRAILHFLEQQDVEMLVDTLGESVSVKRESDAVADNEERPLSRLKGANEARNKTYKMYWNPRPRPRPGWSSGGVRSVKARNISQIWRRRSRQQNLLSDPALQSDLLAPSTRELLADPERS